MDIEHKILKSLITDGEYKSKVIPFLKIEYFDGTYLGEKTLFDIVSDFINTYNKSPTYDIVRIELDNTEGLKQDEVDKAHELINSLEKDTSKDDQEWLIEKTEKFCQDKALYNAITSSIEILKGKTGKERGSIPEILTEALAITFDSNVGHDWLEDFEHRYDFYHMKENKIPFDLDYFNTITKDGVAKKSLNIIMAGTGVGKSMLMCHFAAGYLLQGKNVLYITMEMAEEKIAERIDANLLNIDIDDVKKLAKDVYTQRINKIKGKTNGRLIIKEYPTASASVLNFKSLLNELRLKKSFKPDVIFVDYLNICASCRIKMSSSGSMYTYVKMIAEELRGMAVEYDVPIWSATQTNREGFDNSDPGLNNTSESFGLPATADFMFAAIVNEELNDLNQIMIKQLKNRYGDVSNPARGLIGVNKAKMKFHNLEKSVQATISQVTESKSKKSPSFAPKVDNKIKSTSTLKDKFKGIKV